MGLQGESFEQTFFVRVLSSSHLDYKIKLIIMHPITARLFALGGFHQEDTLKEFDYALALYYGRNI